MLIGAVALCFALFSFEPTDSVGGDNLVGPLGLRAAQLLLGGIGVVGYLAGLLCVATAGAVMLGRVRFPTVLSVVSGLAITLGATILAHLVTSEPEVLGHPAGGALGYGFSFLPDMLAEIQQNL